MHWSETLYVQERYADTMWCVAPLLFSSGFLISLLWSKFVLVLLSAWKNVNRATSHFFTFRFHFSLAHNSPSLVKLEEEKTPGFFFFTKDAFFLLFLVFFFFLCSTSFFLFFFLQRGLLPSVVSGANRRRRIRFTSESRRSCRFPVLHKLVYWNGLVYLSQMV